MHTLMRFTLVCVCVCATFLIIGVEEAKCEDVSGAEKSAEDAGVAADADADVKNARFASLTDTSRRAGVGSGGARAGLRDSQVLSLAAARRKQLYNERPNQHIQTSTAFVHPLNRNGTTSPDHPNLNNAHIKNIDNTATLSMSGKTDEIASKELTRSVSDNKSLLAMKLYQDPRSRAGFLNNRRKESEGARADSTIRAIQDEGGGNNGNDDVIRSEYGVLNDEKVVEQEAILDPEEEFQVDESSHGIYYLNFSDINNITDINKNKIIADNETKENVSNIYLPEILNFNISNESKGITDNGTKLNETIIDAPIKITSPSHNTTVLGTKTENAKDGENKTLFMSEEIYNHFRPLESEIRPEDMAKFLFFGQKLSTPLLDRDNLTSSSAFPSSTKAVNLISSPIEKKRYMSRYSAVERNKNVSVSEDEVNENMDVSVVKNVIEKNKIRHSSKGPAPARHISLLNAYRKPLSPATVSKVQNSSSNTTPVDETKITNFSNREPSLRSNFRNISKNYLNIRRRPLRLTTVESILSNPQNATTEKTSTLVYTAVVTSVSITSSMKGQNKTETTNELDLNKKTAKNESGLQLNSIISENVTSDDMNETTTVRSSSTIKPRHRVRIRTTTERSDNEQPSSTPFILVNRRQPLTNLPKHVDISETLSSSNIKFPSRSSLNTDESEIGSSDIIGTKLSLDGILTIDQRFPNKSEVPTTVWPSTIVVKTRRRPTTAAIASTVRMPTTHAVSVDPDSRASPESMAEEKEHNSTPGIQTTEESNVEDVPFQQNDQNLENIISNEQDQIFNFTNSTHSNQNNIKSVSVNPNEEVVIEAEKNYTASYVLAGLGFLPVTAIVVFVLRNILLKKTKELDTEYEGYFDEDPKKESSITPVARPAMPLPAKPDRKWEFPRNKLRLQTLLGQGNFGQVWKAEADDLSGHDGLTRLVAVKTIKDTATQKEKQELLHEICIMQKLGSHPNVVTLLACCTEQEPYLLIMEYVMCGKLLTYLRERRSRPDRFGGSGTLTSRDLTVFAYCVARGMEYLASKGVVHRDLAARNVLVDHNKLCKIADFGMSREMSTSSEGGDNCSGGGGRSQRHALPVRWMAPEALLYNVFNHESDVWAYGILLWEIVTLGSTPYAAMSGREVLQVVTEGYRLERPAHCKPALYRTMHACWHAAPAQRPSFATIKSQLAELLDNEPSEGNYVDLDSFYQDSSVYSDPSAIIPDDADGEYTAPPPPRNHVARASSAAEFDARFGFPAPPPLRHDFIGSPRMSGFGIRDCGFNEHDFDREGERESNGGAKLGSRGSFSGNLQRLSSRGRELRAFQLVGDPGGGRNKRVPEFECDI